MMMNNCTSAAPTAAWVELCAVAGRGTGGGKQLNHTKSVSQNLSQITIYLPKEMKLQEQLLEMGNNNE